MAAGTGHGMGAEGIVVRRRLRLQLSEQGLLEPPRRTDREQGSDDRRVLQQRQAHGLHLELHLRQALRAGSGPAVLPVRDQVHREHAGTSAPRTGAASTTSQDSREARWRQDDGSMAATVRRSNGSVRGTARRAGAPVQAGAAVKPGRAARHPDCWAPARGNGAGCAAPARQPGQWSPASSSPSSTCCTRRCATSASDLHLTAGAPPHLRIDGELQPDGPAALHARGPQGPGLLDDDASSRSRPFEMAHEFDFAYSVKNLGRFRVNVFMQRGSIGLRRSAPCRRTSSRSRSWGCRP